MTDKEKKEQARWSKSYWLQAPLLAVLAIIPLAMYQHDYPTKLSGFEWFNGSEYQTDYYAYIKMCLLIVCCVYMVLVLLFQHFFNEHRFIPEKRFIPLFVYGVLTIVSTIFSVSRYHSLHGSLEQFEPVWVLLGYCVTAYYTFYLLRTQQSIRRLMIWAVAGAAVMSVIGISQVIGHDIISTDLFKKIITPSEYDVSQFYFSTEKGRAFLTLANPNYVGSYVVLFVPVLLAAAVIFRKIWSKALCIVLALALVVVLLSSESRTGLAGLAGAAIIAVLFLRKTLLKHWKAVIAAVLVFAAAFLGVNHANGNILVDRIKYLTAYGTTDRSLEYIETKQDKIVVGFEGNEINIKWLDKKLYLTDQDNKKLSLREEEDYGWQYVDDDRFPVAFNSWTEDGYKGYQLRYKGNETGYDGVFRFVYETKDTDSPGYYCYFGNKLRKISKGATYTGYFADHEKFGSNRGYIWSRTFPMLKKYFLFGAGPDTYVQLFPYDDIVGLVRVNYNSILITKPHNMYLQIATQTGIPSLIAWLVFLIFYFISCFQTYWRAEKRDGLYYMGIGLMLAVVGFLIVSLANDSLNAITAVFYVILGLGFRVNLLKKNDSETRITQK